MPGFGDHHPPVSAIAMLRFRRSGWSEFRIEVRSCVREKACRHRNSHVASELSVAEHCLNQGAARSPVAIGEWMDGLELRMRQRGMRKNWQIVSLDELHEISDRVGDTIVMRRNEKREVLQRSRELTRPYS
jgi:hypothetical protein